MQESVLECISISGQVVYCGHEQGEITCTEDCSYRVELDILGNIPSRKACYQCRDVSLKKSKAKSIK